MITKHYDTTIMYVVIKAVVCVLQNIITLYLLGFYKGNIKCCAKKLLHKLKTD